MLSGTLIVRLSGTFTLAGGRVITDPWYGKRYGLEAVGATRQEVERDLTPPSGHSQPGHEAARPLAWGAGEGRG